MTLDSYWLDGDPGRCAGDGERIRGVLERVNQGLAGEVRRPPVVIVALLLIVLTIAGCTGVGDDSGTGVAEERVVLGTGARIGGGFVVPSGAELLLPPASLPPAQSQSFTSSWSAALVVSDPLLAISGLADQAESQGFVLTSFNASACRARSSTGQEFAFDEPVPTTDGELGLICQVDGHRERDGVVETLGISARFDESVDGVGAPRAPVIAFGVVKSSAPVDPAATRNQVPVTAIPPPSAVDADRLPLGSMPPTFEQNEPIVDGPTDNAQFDDSFHYNGGTPLQLVLGGCTTGEQLYLEARAGEADELFNRYTGQLPRVTLSDTEKPDVFEDRLFGRQVRFARQFGDGQVGEVTLVKGRQDEPDRLLLTVCGEH